MKQHEIDEFLRTARDRFEAGRKADAVDRKIAEDDTRFAYADDVDLAQWDDAAKAARVNRPILQWNRIPTYVHQVVNDGRQNNPSIVVTPEDGGATRETAEYIQSRVRHIEYESNADIAKDCARSQQVVSGRGFIRVKTEWIPGTQRQRICIDRIENQFSVVWDPASRKYDRSDAGWCFVISHISKDQHIRDYGEDSVVSRMDFTGLDNPAPEWIGVGGQGDQIQIAEYWLKEWTDQTVPADGTQPARTEKVAKVWCYIVNGIEILRKQEWIGSTIPIVPYWGEEAIVDSRLRTHSLIRNAKHPQKLANLTVSNIGEETGQIPKAPYLVPVGGIAANHEQGWQNANNTPLAYLYFQAYDAIGKPLPRPERIKQEPPIQALLQQLNVCFDGIKASMGIFDAALGAAGNETSGIAIQRRQKESDVSNYHFPANEKRSIKYLGKILVELIPKLDRPGGAYPIRTEEGKTHVVPIGQPVQDWKTGVVVTHDLESGQYGVAVSTGPSYTSARQAEGDRDISLIQANPELMWSIGPSMLRADDSPGAENRATALEKYIAVKFNGLSLKPETSGGPEVPPQIQAQLAKMGEELQTTQAFAQSLHEQIQNKTVEAQQAIKLKEMDLEFQREKLAVEERLGLVKVASVEGIEELRQQLSILMRERELMHAADQQAHVHEHEAEQAEADRQAAAEAAAQQPQMEGV